MCNNWMNIETAPKGELVLRYIPAVVDRRNPHQAMMDIGYGVGYGFRRATHWMKLPEPPKEA